MQADLVHVLWRDVENDGFVVGRVECILLDGGLLLLQTPPITNKRHFDVGICANTAHVELESEEISPAEC